MRRVWAWLNRRFEAVCRSEEGPAYNQPLWVGRALTPRRQGSRIKVLKILEILKKIMKFFWNRVQALARHLSTINWGGQRVGVGCGSGRAVTPTGRWAGKWPINQFHQMFLMFNVCKGKVKTPWECFLILEWIKLKHQQKMSLYWKYFLSKIGWVGLPRKYFLSKIGWVGLPSPQQPDANLAPPSSHPVNISTGDTHWQKIINTNIPRNRAAKIFFFRSQDFVCKYFTNVLAN